MPTAKKLRAVANRHDEQLFVRRLPCASPLHAIREYEAVKLSSSYPRGAALFVEGQTPRGVFFLCEGRAKVSIASPEGKTVVLRIAQPGELLGVNAAITGRPYEVTAEAIEHCRVDFVRRKDLLRILDRDKKAYCGVVQALSNRFSGVVEHARVLLLSQSAAEKLARLLIKWCDEVGTWTPQGIRVNPGLTHEEMGQMICTSRETVTRVLSEFRRRRIVHLTRNSILVRNRRALESVANCWKRPR
ncbi:MAG TPA: Crp/Fnr family transcriptional regulator [Pyrinomonadaceae bacterium]|nr:Crp/Fnr family transcriptional regulator [Pyrinomonadaceae bacterium]